MEAIKNTNDPKRLSNYYYNMGNAFYKQKNYKASVDSYKNALRNNPDNDDARHNLILAQKMLLQQQNQQDQQNKDNKDNKDKKDNKQDENNQNQQNQKDQQQNQQQKPQQQQGQISKEDAERLLNALEQQEKDVLDKLDKQKAILKKKPVEKEW